MSYKTIAHGPTVSADRGTAARRTVLRECQTGHSQEYVVHYQFFYSNGKSGYGDGQYFPVRWGNRTISLKSALSRAWEAFVERCEKDLESIYGLQARKGTGVLSGGEEEARAHL
jgi:hypothetical protein